MRRSFVVVMLALAAAFALAVPPATAAPVRPAAHSGWVRVTSANQATLLHGRSVQEALAGTTIYSTANSRYVSAELGYTGGDQGMLRARATAVGPWEQYTFSVSGSTVIIMSTANNRYVSAELGYTGGDQGMLRARATAVGPWEKFNLFHNQSSGRWALQSQANSRYVSAELGYTGGDQGMLRARATEIGPWEQYVLNG